MHQAALHEDMCSASIPFCDRQHTHMHGKGGHADLVYKGLVHVSQHVCGVFSRPWWQLWLRLVLLLLLLLLLVVMVRLLRRQ